MTIPKIRILHNLARTGGTLISKCLGCMSEVILLSEIHPLSMHFPFKNPLVQARWHNINIFEENITFVKCIQIIEQKCAENSKKLVIRDWAHLDFIGLPYIEQPSYRMTIVDYLSTTFEVIQYAIVRHPIDQWMSSYIRPAFQNVSLNSFLDGYFEFAMKIKDIGFIRYEDFTREPEKEMQIICDRLEIKYDKDFILKWFLYNKITGDVKKNSRGSLINRITPLPRRHMEKSLLNEFRQNKNYWKALDLLRYHDHSID